MNTVENKTHDYNGTRADRLVLQVLVMAFVLSLLIGAMSGSLSLACVGG